MTDDELLQKYAHPREDKPGYWWITFYDGAKPAAELVPFIRAQLALGVRVTEVLEMSAWVALVDRLLAVERQLRDHRDADRARSGR